MSPMFANHEFTGTTEDFLDGDNTDLRAPGYCGELRLSRSSCPHPLKAMSPSGRIPGNLAADPAATPQDGPIMLAGSPLSALPMLSRQRSCDYGSKGWGFESLRAHCRS
jgi:hypothetical protein